MGAFSLLPHHHTGLIEYTNLSTLTSGPEEKAYKAYGSQRLVSYREHDDCRCTTEYFPHISYGDQVAWFSRCFVRRTPRQRTLHIRAKGYGSGRY